MTMNLKSKLFILKITGVLCCLCFYTSAHSQKDSLVLNNRDIVVGEIKSMKNGVITIETDYSKNDFTIKWSKVNEIYSKNNFLITLKNGDRINGSLQSIEEGRKLRLTSIENQTNEAVMDDIVFLKGLKSTFWSRAYGSIDLGLNLTKANNLWQYSMRSAFGYLTNKWQLDLYYNDIRSRQDSVEPTERTESGISFKYFLPKDWFMAASLDFLSNTEQALKLRTTGKLGVGKFIVHTNRTYWGLAGGLSLNNENFSNEQESRNSLEGFMGSDLNLFDIGDLSLKNTVYAYPSFTESGRWRVDFSLDAKYDLPYNIYLKLGWTFNYDNRPAIAGNDFDYVVVFSVGWEFNR